VVSCILDPVLSLKGGERGTCLGPPFIGDPLEVFRSQIFIIFGEKPIGSYNVFRCTSSLCILCCFQRDPPKQVYCASTLLSKGAQQQLQCAVTLISKEHPIATALCWYSDCKRAPNGNCKGKRLANYDTDVHITIV